MTEDSTKFSSFVEISNVIGRLEILSISFMKFGICWGGDIRASNEGGNITINC